MEIKKDTTTKKDRYYFVLRNPHVNYPDIKMIYGPTEQAVKDKVAAQLSKWKELSSKVS